MAVFVWRRSFGLPVPRVAEMGFDLIEVPIEAPGNIDNARAADMIRDHNLGVSVCAVIGSAI